MMVSIKSAEVPSDVSTLSSMMVLSPSAAEVALGRNDSGPSLAPACSARAPMVLRSALTQSTPKPVPRNLHMQVASMVSASKRSLRTASATASRVWHAKAWLQL